MRTSTVTIGSIANKELVDQQMEEFQPDVVVHTAASYKDPDDWHSDTMTNCVGGSNIVSAAKKFNVKRFVYYQTALCYGLSPQQSPIRLDHPRKPEGSSYAISKTANELYLELSGLDFVTFRLANVIGSTKCSWSVANIFSTTKRG